MARAPMPKDGKDDYFVLDQKAESIGGKRIIDERGERQTTVRLSPAEAAFAIANGSISTEDPEKSRHARRAVEANLGTRVNEDTGEGLGRGDDRRKSKR